MADIIIDDRAGSADLHSCMPAGVSELGHLEFGDCAWVGSGPGGRPVPVGVEYKRLSDVLKCIVDGRFAGHQLPGLIRDYKFVYLVVEGLFKTDERSGVLLQRRGSGWRKVTLGSRQFMGSEFERWIMTMEHKANIRYHHVTSLHAAARYILALYKWWEKGWDNHKAHLALHQDRPDGQIVKATLLRRVAAELPGIGWKRSLAVERKFKSLSAMFNADVTEWCEIEGIGKLTAENVTRELRRKK